MEDAAVGRVVVRVEGLSLEFGRLPLFALRSRERTSASTGLHLPGLAANSRSRGKRDSWRRTANSGPLSQTRFVMRSTLSTTPVMCLILLSPLTSWTLSPGAMYQKGMRSLSWTNLGRGRKMVGMRLRFLPPSGGGCKCPRVRCRNRPASVNLDMLS